MLQLLRSDNLDYTRFAIVCTSRSGSTWLHTLVNSHPQIISQGEIVLKKFKEGSVCDLQKDVFHRYHPSIKAVGLKVFYGLENTIYESIMESILNDHEIQIIHLIRKDRLAQYTSLQLAKKSREWSHTSQELSQTIQIDPDDFQQFDANQMQLQKELDQNFKDRVLTISYEALITNQKKTLDSIQQFLGVPEKKLFSVLKRQSTSALNERIENWTDFETAYEKGR